MLHLTHPITLLQVILIPALIVSSSLEASELGEQARVYVKETWGPWWETFRDELRHDPPAEGSSQERLLAARFLDSVVSITKELGLAQDRAARLGLRNGIESLRHKEGQEAAADWKLGLQLLRQAIEVLDNFIERMPALPASSEGSEHALAPESVLIVRVEMQISVAFDLASEGPVDEFYIWAQRAVMTSRQADILLPSLSSMDHGLDLSMPRASAAEPPSLYEALHDDQDPPNARVLLDEQGAATVLDLLEQAPAPNETMCRLFRDATA